MKTKKTILALTLFVALLSITIYACKKFEKVALVKTNEVSNIDATGSEVGATIMDFGDAEKATAYGWCWNTSQNPTVANNKTDLGEKDELGDFINSIKGLNPATKYYARPYMQTEEEIIYGEEIEISTEQLSFTITTPTEGSILGFGFSYDINWTANISDSVKIELYQGSTLAETLAESTTNTGTYNWAVSTSIQASTIYTIVITSVNNATVKAESATFTIATDAPPTVSTQATTSVESFTATANGTIVNFGTESSATQHGHCWSETETPTTAESKTELGNTSTTGTFTSSLANLDANTTYYVRAYAINNIGTSYGAQQTFTTLDAPTPTLTTNTVTDIAYTTATCGGNVTSQGDKNKSITARGVCYSTSPTPDLTDDYTTNGTGTGTFTSSLTSLTENTTYYVRAYATNSIGTSYGEEKTFTTLDAQDFSGEMITVTGGSFEMGCGTGQSSCGSDETPVHTVTLDNFSISKYEITNQQYANFLAVYGSSTVLSGDYAGQTMIYESSGSYDWGLHNNGGTWEPVSGYENHPVIYVTWYGANEFCQFYGGSLPTEAEWEYAARGGTNYTDYYLYSGSNTADDVAWYSSNSGSATHGVGTKTANQLGIHDMSGNVWEWCSDWYDSDYYNTSPTNNPQGASSGSYRVIRGGSWYGSASNLRSANRYSGSPSGNYNFIGFRFVQD